MTSDPIHTVHNVIHEIALTIYMRRRTFRQHKLQCKPRRFVSHPVLEVSVAVLTFLRSAEQSHLGVAEKILASIAVSSGQQKSKLDYTVLHHLLKHAVPF